jgi:hypothetical protein
MGLEVARYAPVIRCGTLSRVAARLTAALLALSAAAFGQVCTAHAGDLNPLAFAPTLRCTADPEAASTVPGWTIVSGSPALRCGSALSAPGSAPSVPRAVVANGPYGASALERLIPLGSATSGQRHFTLSASFGAFGRGSGRAVLTGEFLGASGQPLGAPVVLRGPPAVTRTLPVRFEPRSVAGMIPTGAVEMALRLDLGGRTSVARSYVAAMRLETTPPMSFPPPAPPPARVPRFDHVFLIMMENTDYGQVIGDRKNAPYMNSLAARGTVLADYQGVYHPSDENYLAIAGGDTFVRGAVYFPKIHVAAENLGDLLEAAGRSWKEYSEGMGTPCNVTTRYDRNFEPDDAPFINFTDIQSNPGRCRAHLVDLSEWFKDLNRAATTPAFAWLAADDYDDGELPGNGSPKSLRVQDAWLKRTLDPLFDSPAWREQKSLLILTWDESSRTVNNHIATIVVGSRGTVKSAYVSRRRYDHYSTARTVEAALGLPSMTSDDAYAPAFDDAFVFDAR